LAVAEAHAHDLSRRRAALLFLFALPLLFYAADSGHSGPHAVETTIIATAFSVVGAGIFTALAGRVVDSRLVLAGYKPSQLLAGRLLVVAAASIPILGATTVVVTTVSHPAHPGLVVVAAAALGLVGVPLGFVIGLLVPRDLEAVLLMIGIVGVQLSLDSSQTLNTALPFGGPRRLAQAALAEPRAVLPAMAITVAYATGLLATARIAAGLRTGRRQRPKSRLASKPASAE
jgi:hypothetical protein